MSEISAPFAFGMEFDIKVSTSACLEKVKPLSRASFAGLVTGIKVGRGRSPSSIQFRCEDCERRAFIQVQDSSWDFLATIHLGDAILGRDVLCSHIASSVNQVLLPNIDMVTYFDINRTNCKSTAVVKRSIPTFDPHGLNYFNELGCGIGGFAFAAIAQGLQLQAAIDSDYHTVKEYRRLHAEGAPSAFIEQRDMVQRDWWHQIMGSQFVFSGWPCQPWSGAGLRRGPEDHRAQFLWALVQYLEMHQPVAGTLECVENFTKLGGGKYMHALMKALDVAGFNAISIIRNAQDFLPQFRKRVIVDFVRKDVFARINRDLLGYWAPKVLPFPPSSIESRKVQLDESSMPLPVLQRLTLDSHLLQIYGVPTRNSSWPWKTYQRVLSRTAAAPTILRSIGEAHNLPTFPRDPKLHGFVFQFLAVDDDGQETVQYRFPHPLECFALQGFPIDMMKWCDEESDLISAWQWAGNAVPPTMILPDVVGLLIMLGKAFPNQETIMLEAVLTTVRIEYRNQVAQSLRSFLRRNDDYIREAKRVAALAPAIPAGNDPCLEDPISSSTSSVADLRKQFAIVFERNTMTIQADEQDTLGDLRRNAIIALGLSLVHLCTATLSTKDRIIPYEDLGLSVSSAGVHTFILKRGGFSPPVSFTVQILNQGYPPEDLRLGYLAFRGGLTVSTFLPQVFQQREGFGWIRLFLGQLQSSFRLRINGKKLQDTPLAISVCRGFTLEIRQIGRDELSTDEDLEVQCTHDLPSSAELRVFNEALYSHSITTPQRTPTFPDLRSRSPRRSSGFDPLPVLCDPSPTIQASFRQYRVDRRVQGWTVQERIYKQSVAEEINGIIFGFLGGTHSFSYDDQDLHSGLAGFVPPHPVVLTRTVRNKLIHALNGNHLYYYVFGVLFDQLPFQISSGTRNKLMHALNGNTTSSKDPWTSGKDPWATATLVNIPSPSRRQGSKWEDLELPNDHPFFFSDTERLRQVHVSEVRQGASGVAFAGKSTWQSFITVGSIKPLAILVPDTLESDLKKTSLWGPKVTPVSILVYDPLLKVRDKKAIFIIPLTLQEIVIKEATLPLQINIEPVADFIVHVDLKYGDAAIVQAFKKSPSEYVKSQIFAAFPLADMKLVELSTLRPPNPKAPELIWTAYLRVYAQFRDRVLIFSGANSIIYIQDPLGKRMTAPTDLAVIWLSGHSWNQVKQKAVSIVGYLGLGRSTHSLGVRVKVQSLPDARIALRPSDPRFTETNREVVGREFFEITGLPRGIQADHLVSMLHIFAWPIVPIRSFMRGNLQTWVVSADKEPPQDKVLLQTNEVATEWAFITKLPSTRRKPDSGRNADCTQASQPRQSSPAKGRRPEPSSSSDQGIQQSSKSFQHKPSSDLEARVNAIESRMIKQENLTINLERKLDSNFADLMSAIKSLGSSSSSTNHGPKHYIGTPQGKPAARRRRGQDGWDLQDGVGMEA